MARPLAELQQLSHNFGAPIVCAGDIFDKPNPPPELVNFAIANLPPMYAIPGQHDLLYHNYTDIRKTAYWTLCEADVITNLFPCENRDLDDREILPGGITLHAFPWSFKPAANKWKQIPGVFHVAVLHAYCWKKNYAHPGAEAGYVEDWGKDLQGFDFAVFGDNHQGFISRSNAEGWPTIINCGGFMRRHSQEASYIPRVWFLFSDGMIQPQRLQATELDVFEATISDSVAGETIDVESFLNELRGLADDQLDFPSAVRRACSGLSKPVQKIIEQSLEKSP